MAPPPEGNIGPPQFSDEWQNECRTLSERYGVLRRLGAWTDCEFEGSCGERAAAHRVLLAAASPVFAAMLYGPCAAFADPKPIRIDDLDFEIFKLLLEYMYTDNITIESCKVACPLYCGAHKYMLTHLQAVCKAYILDNVSPASVFQVYEMAQLFDEKELVDKCLELMKSETRAVLETGKPEEAELETLVTLFSMDSLAIDSELDLFKALEWFAVAHTRETPVAEQTLKEDGKLTIRDALNKIRFLAMSPKEFASYDTSSLLTESEMLAIAMNLISDKAIRPMPDGFSDSKKPR